MGVGCLGDLFLWLLPLPLGEGAATASFAALLALQPIFLGSALRYQFSSVQQGHTNQL